jgi:hypothetical protein
MKLENNLQTNTEQLFNTGPLLSELNNVIQNSLNKLLSNYITNYKLYEETHNCIMNLPSVKREIAKKCEPDEDYDDLPDLISISDERESSDEDVSYEDVSSEYINYSRIPIQDESDQESEDTMLCIKKVANQLLKEKQEMIASYLEKEKSYKEKYDKEIVELKDRINTLFEQSTRRYDLFYEQKALYENAIEKYNKEIADLKILLNNCVKQPLASDLTASNDEINQEKENIILHIEEESNNELEEEDEDEESEKEEDEDEESDDEAEAEDEESDDEAEAEDEEDEESEKNESDNEAEESEFIANDEIEESEEKIESEEEVEVEVEVEVESEDEVEDEAKEEDEVETEKSASEDEEEEEEELIEIEIDDVTYCTENEDNGFIYELDKDGNVGESVGYLKDGEPFFN